MIGQWQSAGCKLLYLLVIHSIQGRLVIPEVLHRTLNQTTLAWDRLVADLFDCEINRFYGSRVVYNIALQVVEHVEIRVLEQIEGLVFIHRCDPACVHAEEQAELFIEEVLLCACARPSWHP